MPSKLPDPVDIHVGSSLRARRQVLGLSQSKLAASLGLTFQQVQKYEKGTNRMGASRLQQVAAILQVPVTHFFDGAPGRRKPRSDAPSVAYLTEFLANPDGVTLARAFGKIKHAKVRRNIVRLVREIVGG